ncbi:MAG: hypothetical protein LBT09_10100 [Planctomycetaceae bacterium]|nr:hypothetical protein [Planctomycetaceae bacterium]
MNYQKCQIGFLFDQTSTGATVRRLACQPNAVSALIYRYKNSTAILLFF